MAIVIAPFTEKLTPAVKDLNSRLDAAGAPREFRFPEHHLPVWPKLDGRRLYEEYFVLLENETARGCYIFRRQEFSFHGSIRPIGFWHGPISEGMVNNKYSWVLLRMLANVLKVEPLLYGLAPTDRMRKIWTALGWSMCLVPFYFRVNRFGSFFREIRALRRTRTLELVMDIAGGSGAGPLSLKLLQSACATRAVLNERAEAVQGFSDWADNLWNTCKGQYAMIAVRDCETLNIMYPRDSRKFLYYKVSRGGTVLGWAVLLDTQMTENRYFGNLRVGSIVDCLASAKDASAVIRASTETLEERGVDLVVSNQSHSAWRAGLRDAGFLRGPSNYPYWASKELAKLLHPLDTNMAQFHLTRGDGDGPIHL